MDIYQYFLKNTSYQKGEKIAIGVSGGADSMALLTMACADIYANDIVVLTFDHQLRSESAQEAEFVAEYCKKLGCQHIILRSDNYQIKPNQNDARKMRYQYFLAYCMLNKIGYLLTAHHKDDQSETYYIRLLQNSHLWGLAGISDSSYNHNIQILRPLLTINAQSLKEYLKKKNIAWVEDPSNKNPKYLRTKIRKLLQSKQLSEPNLKPLQNYRNKLTNFMNIWAQKHIQQIAVGYMTIEREAFEKLPLELKLHIFHRYLQEVGCSTYGLPLSTIEDNYQQLLSADLFSLGGCLIYADNDYIHLQHEYRRNKNRAIFTYNNQLTLFDNQFHIFHLVNKRFQIIYLGDIQNKFNDKLNELISISNKKKFRYIKSLPIVIDDENEILLPYIHQTSWGNNKWKVFAKENSAAGYCQKYFIDPSF